MQNSAGSIMKFCSGALERSAIVPLKTLKVFPQGLQFFHLCVQATSWRKPYSGLSTHGHGNLLKVP